MAGCNLSVRPGNGALDGVSTHSWRRRIFHGPITLHEEFAIPGVADSQGLALSRETVPQVMSVAKQNLRHI